MSSTAARGRTVLSRDRALARGAAGVVAGVLALGGLAGCATPAGTPGAAAVVDGRTITVAEVTSVTDELAPLFPGFDAQTAVSVLAVAPVYFQLGQEFGVVVSDEDAQTFLDDRVGVVAGESGAGYSGPEEFDPSTIELVRYVLTVNQLSESAEVEQAQTRVVELLEAIDADFNPRYGTIDLVTNEAVPASWPWLVPAAPQPPA